jgi:hypothetical protein
MLDMTLEQGHDIFLKALSGNNFSHESIAQFLAVCSDPKTQS